MSARQRQAEQNVSVRDAQDTDLARIAAIASATGQRADWSGTNPAYIRHLMREGRVVVAEAGDGIVGFGAAQRIGAGADAVSVLCDLFVDPAAHGSGYGRAMLSELWDGAASRMTFSSLHAHAIPLYTNFGLDAWWPLLYLYGEAASVPMPAGWSVTPAAPDAVGKLERGWTGIERTADHRAWADRPGGMAVTASVDGEPRAAGTVAGPPQDFGVMHLAMSAEADDGAAAAAVLAVLASAGGPGQVVGISLPAPHPAVRPLLSAGWRFDEFDLFMATDRRLLDARRSVPSPAQA
jgi:GNAT superfamily N-acetyltransferase